MEGAPLAPSPARTGHCVAAQPRRRLLAAVMLLVGVLLANQPAASLALNHTTGLAAVEGPTSRETALKGAAEGDLESLLHWAVSQSDPEALRQAALTAGGGKEREKMSLEDLKKLADQRARIREALDALNEAPTETDLMKEAIVNLQVYSSPPEGKFNETQEEVEFITNTLRGLQILVEPIDNANDLKVLGGILPLLKLLKGPKAVRIGTAAVIGTAASNNPVFQGHVLELEPKALESLLVLVDSEEADEEATKGLYAVAAMIRNMPEAQTTFFEADGIEILGRAIQRAAKQSNTKFVTRCMQLAADLAAHGPGVRKSLLKKGHLVAGIMVVLDQPGAQLDLLEASLFAVEALAADNPSRQALSTAGTGAKLDGLSQRLKPLLKSEKDAEYAEEVLQLIASIQSDMSKLALEVDHEDL